MLRVIGELAPPGFGHFRRRMTLYADVFERATGEKLFPGTLNVRLKEVIAIREHFRIKGPDIDEAYQDLLFERCWINGIPAYRIRPFVLLTGFGGHGPRIIEIACAQQLNTPELDPMNIELTFDR